MRLKWSSPILLLRALWRVIKFRAYGDRVLAPKEEMARREAICRACPHYANEQCKLCTCFVGIKVMLAAESCPDDPPRWRTTRFP